MKKLLLGVVLMLVSSIAASATIEITPSMVGTTSTVSISQDATNRATWNILGSSELTSSNLLFDLIVTASTGQSNGLNLSVSNNNDTNIISTSLDTLISGITFNGSSIITAIVAGTVNGNISNRTLTLTISNIRNAVEVSEVPLPAAVWLFGSVLLGGLAFRRKAAQKRQLALAV